MAHRGAARDVDFNRSKPYYLVTCGEDRLVKFWDARKPSAPVKHLAGHTHWWVGRWAVLVLLGRDARADST